MVGLKGEDMTEALQLVLTDDELFDDAIAAESEASPSRWRAADDYAELHERGYTQEQIGERVGKAQSHISYCLKVVSNYHPGDIRPDFQTAYDEAKGKKDGPGILGSSESNEWYTPAEYVESARVVLEVIDLDPASCEEAQVTVKARRFFDLGDDCLAQDWIGNVFMNPPYGRACAAFVAKLLEEYEAGRTTSAILLVSAYSTETIWFQPLFNHPICFPDHRLRGWPNPTFGSAFVYLGPSPDAFVSEFSKYGPIVSRLYR